jgi:hypothetical protein
VFAGSDEKVAMGPWFNVYRHTGITSIAGFRPPIIGFRPLIIAFRPPLRLRQFEPRTNGLEVDSTMQKSNNVLKRAHASE